MQQTSNLDNKTHNPHVGQKKIIRIDSKSLIDSSQFMLEEEYHSYSKAWRILTTYAESLTDYRDAE